MVVKLLVVISLSRFFRHVNCVLPPYIPALQRGDLDRNSLIERYFHLDFDYVEILASLLLLHGFSLSIRQLKRILSQLGLRRRKNQSDPVEIIAAAEDELKQSGSLLGYRLMHQRLRLCHGIVTSKEVVRKVLSYLDPDGVALRSQRKLKRRKYFTKGPNYMWHIDGYDKLKPYGFCVHGAIDGFSRRVMWLEVGHSNNNPRIIATYFHDCVKQIGGTPHRCRSDQGTENVNVAAMQRFFRRNALDEFAGEKSFLYGKSTSNQRIEGWWTFLRKSESDFWIKYFKDLRDQGLYVETDKIHVECLKFCYMPLLREELYKVAAHWNLHKIRPSSNNNSPHGRPDINYFIPEAFGTISYLEPVSKQDLAVAKNVCCEIPVDDYTRAFEELAQMIMRENNMLMGTNVHEAESLYVSLVRILRNII